MVSISLLHHVYWQHQTVEPWCAQQIQVQAPELIEQVHSLDLWPIYSLINHKSASLQCCVPWILMTTTNPLQPSPSFETPKTSKSKTKKQTHRDVMTFSLMIRIFFWASLCLMGSCLENDNMGHQIQRDQNHFSIIPGFCHKEANELLPNRVGSFSPCRLDSMKMLTQCERRDDICATEKTKTINDPAWVYEGGEALINNKNKKGCSSRPRRREKKKEMNTERRIVVILVMATRTSKLTPPKHIQIV